MSKPSVPQFLGWGDGMSLRTTWMVMRMAWRNWVQTAVSSTAEQGCLRFEVLNKKGFRVNFNKASIIIGKLMGRKQILANMRRVQDIG
jgi:hypothetical protein